MSWRRCLLIAAILAWTSHAYPADLCPASDDVAGVVTPFPKVATALKPGGHLKVLAIGSATMFGPDASQAFDGAAKSAAPPKGALPQGASQRAFPWQMARALQAAVPGLQVDVAIRGGRGMAASDMLPLLRDALQADHFQLVLWQTGTVEAVRNSSPSDFAQVLSDGAEDIRASGANLVLIDPQYSRFLQANSNLDPYFQDLQQVAAMPGVMLFHRFDLMRAWADAGGLDLEHTPKSDRRRVVDAVQACVGDHLARMVMAAAQS